MGAVYSIISRTGGKGRTRARGQGARGKGLGCVLLLTTGHSLCKLCEQCAPSRPEPRRADPLRPARHPADVGVDGQRRLKAARVLCVGAGGLGSPAAMYLAAAGVGTLGIVDFDDVDASNLQRQILHDTAGTGRPKVESARDRLRAINPNVSVEMHRVRLTSATPSASSSGTTSCSTAPTTSRRATW